MSDEHDGPESKSTANDAPEEAAQAGRSTEEPPGEPIDPTGADPSERRAKDELFEAIDHFRSAATILFDRASKDPAVKQATSEAERLARKLGDAAEPLARQLTSEVGRLTDDVWKMVEGKGKRAAPPPPPPKDEAPSDERSGSSDEEA
ncbi:MAG TPA: hypothetical protein RMH99_31805 [Sandaracinaceae bacterium LLY-WYZ-13_1]|nr:hypothetical protein [Sandaracinaceae bacterium LLY-WYZ-13_1]